MWGVEACAPAIAAAGLVALRIVLVACGCEDAVVSLGGGAPGRTLAAILRRGIAAAPTSL